MIARETEKKNNNNDKMSPLGYQGLGSRSEANANMC